MSNQSEPVQQPFIQNERFQLLKQYQQEIFQATEISPSIRKIVNELINMENLEAIKSRFVKTWRESSE